MSSPDSSSNDESLEILKRSPQILQVLTTFFDSYRNESLVAASTRLEKVIKEQTRLQQNALAEPAYPASAAESVPRQVLQMERSMLWTFEAGRDGIQSLRLPRPSIIGRALYDLQQEAADYEGSTPADIYQTISAKGPHHLSAPATTYVARYRAGETGAMSGKINIHMEPRFKVLAKPTNRPNYAEHSRTVRYLTGHGIKIFHNWPHWDSRDNDLTGDGPSPSGSPAPAGGTGTT